MRRARDGHPYSWEEFVVHYGRRAAWQMWDAAPEVAAAGATEHGVLPGEPHPKSGSPALVPAQRPPGDATLPAGAPATLQGAAAAAATAAFAGVAGAGDDATERTAAAPPPQLEADNTGARADWATSHFATVLLGQREQALPGPPQRETSIRAALVAATRAADMLPLKVAVFFEGDVEKALGTAHTVLVTAERMNGVPDPNHDGALRVDLVAYYRNGDTTRYHPGSRPSQSATPHTMSQGSPTFDTATAMRTGVGAALHLRPPGVIRRAAAATEHGGNGDAAELGAELRLCEAMDLHEIHSLDSKVVSARVVESAIAAAHPPGGPMSVDWSVGGFPWWVFMAGRARHFYDMLQEGVLAVNAERRRDGAAALTVRTAVRIHIVSVAGGRLRVITPT